MNYNTHIRNAIETQLTAGKRDFILFPFGEWGMLTKRILNEVYGIQEVCLIDNHLARFNPNIKELSCLREEAYKSCTILITSDNEDIYEELRNSVRAYADKSRIVDIFERQFDRTRFMRPKHITKVQELPKALIQWYKFRKGAKALFVVGGQECFEVLPEAMAQWDVSVDCRRLSEFEIIAGAFADIRENYDYIVLAGALERSKSPAVFLKTLHNLLNPGGVLLIGADNRLGIRYFCGDRDLFTERNFDGIEDYRRVGTLEWKKMEGRAYSKAELIRMLETAGFTFHRFYSILPEWTRPQILCAEDCIPRGRLNEMVIPQYHSPDSIFLEEEWLYDTLIENNLFHAMANGYLIECPLDGCFFDADQVITSIESGRREALATVFRKDGSIEKRALYKEGREKIERMSGCAEELKEHGINMAKLTGEGESLIMSGIRGENALEYLRRLLCEDKVRFLNEMDRFVGLIENSSECVPYEEVDWEHFDPDWNRRKKDDPGRDKWKKIALGHEGKREDLGVILKRGYMDLVPRNCIYADGEFVFYDQEHCIERLPAHVVARRAIDQIYWGTVWEKALLSKEELMERYHLKEYERLWGLYIGRFMERIQGEKELLEYHQHCRRDWTIVNANRYRMNYSENEYERVFKDIFKGTQGRKLYLFGSGIFAEKFLEQFGSDYEIEGILDNNPQKWGTKLEGIGIFSPEILKSLPEDSYKVMICIKNCVPIMEQLKNGLGVSHYSVYDWHQEYPRNLPAETAAAGKEKREPKKYHIGYIAGVFDLFHIGHLNLFKRAKEQCDYLIVGVVSDESVMENKKTMPCMPFEERIELVRSCRYVDEAVGLPTYNGDTDEAYRRYQFDVQFSGSDYANDPKWLAKKAYLEKRGAQMVFFPYTEGISTTRLKEVVRE